MGRRSHLPEFKLSEMRARPFRRLISPFSGGYRLLGLAGYQFRSLALDVLNGKQPFAFPLPKPIYI